jgi:DNA-binding transcriptional LysR family regulator
MNLDHLRYFLVVAQTGSIRGAAELLRISPSALSRALQQLERGWDVKLFSPSGRGIAITDEGRALQLRAARLMTEFESFSADVGSRSLNEQPLRIASFEVFSTHFLAWAIERFMPERAVLMRELTPGEIESSLLRHEADVGITYLPVPNEGLDYLKVASQEMEIFGRPEKFAAMPFAELPFCVPVSAVAGAASAVQGLDGWPLNGPPRKIRYQVQMLETALGVCSRGMGVLFAPPFLIRLFNEPLSADRRLEKLPMPPRTPSASMDIYLAKRKATVETRDVKILARAIREACKEKA